MVGGCPFQKPAIFSYLSRYTYNQVSTPAISNLDNSYSALILQQACWGAGILIVPLSGPPGCLSVRCARDAMLLSDLRRSCKSQIKMRVSRGIASQDFCFFQLKHWLVCGMPSVPTVFVFMIFPYQQCFAIFRFRSCHRLFPSGLFPGNAFSSPLGPLQHPCRHLECGCH